MRRITYLHILNELERMSLDHEYKEDHRAKNPNKNHLDNFLYSWREFISTNKGYSEKTMETLTWTNLGERMAVRFGEQSEEEMIFVFRILKEEHNKMTE